MEFNLKTLLSCGFVLILGYIFARMLIVLVSFNRKCRTLRKLPQLPSHWLYGHARELCKESSKSFVEFSARVMEETGAKLFLLWAGPFPFVHICHPATFKQVNKKVLTKDNSMAGPYRLLADFIGQGLLASNGTKWERNRKLLSPAFHFKTLSGYVLKMNNLANTLTEILTSASASGESVDIFPYICRYTLDTLVSCSFSYEGNFQQNHKPWQMVDFLFYLCNEGQELKRLCKFARGFSTNIIKARKEELKNQPELKDRGRLDFLDTLLSARDEHGNGLTDEEIRDEVDTLTAAGFETTACTMSWTIFALGLHREAQELVYKDVVAVLGDETEIKTEHLGKFSYLTQFLKETMRYYSPVPGFTRRNERPIEIDGYEIPSGCSITIQSYQIHHNKHVWEYHNEFKPERFDASQKYDDDFCGFIPFSAGPRNCIGQTFAMNEIKIGIAKLVKRFEIVTDPDHETDIRPEYVTRPSDGIKVFLKKRQN